MTRLTTFLLFLFSLPLLADTQVTHTFEDGEVISAEEFNKNFDDLEAAIDSVGGGGGTGIPSGSLAIKTSSGVILGRVVQPNRGRPDAYTTVDGNVVIIGELDDFKFSRGDPISVRYAEVDCAGIMYLIAYNDNLPQYGINAAGDFVYPSGVMQSYTARSIYGLSQGCENSVPYDTTGFPSTAAPNFPVDLDAIDGEYIQYIVAP